MIELFANEAQTSIVIHNLKEDTYVNFSPVEIEFIEKTLEIIERDFPEEVARLNELYEKCADKNFRKVLRHWKCNGSLHDNVIDIDDDWNFNLEHVRCPLRGGFCNDENVICHPKLNLELTKREIEITKLLVQEFNFAEIGDRLYISPFTVENHKKRIFKKLNIHNLASLINYAYKNALINK